MLNGNSITLGSLFDGIGAFPYAASFFGIKPLWASEILPNSISITKRHFPEMEHLGDITQLDGGKIPPVDVICFGSPCQSFSVAGPRTGFAGKSGLFWEAIRIIKEMRCATNGKYPQIACFENVIGILNCNSGLDYQAVISAFTETEVPIPVSGKWANAGMVRGGDVDFAWVVKNAQYYRVPQRRKRVLAIADFTGGRAAEILFESKSLSGYFAARELARQGITADVTGGAHGEGCGRVTAAFMAGQAKNARSIAYSETLSPTLKGAASGLNQTPSVLCVATGQSDALAAASDDLAPTLTLNHEAPYICKEQTAYGICSQSSNSMRSGNPFSGIYEAEMCKTLDTTCLNPTCNQGGIAVVEGSVPCEPKIARTLTARYDSSPCVDRGQNVVAFHQNQLGEVRGSEVAYTLGTNANATGRNSPVVAFAQNQRAEVRDLNDLAGCLAAEPGMKQQTYIVHPDVAGTLCGSGAGTSRTAGNCNETDLAIAYCLQGNMIGRADKNGPQGKGVNEEISFTLNTIDKHAVAAVDCRNYKEIGDMSGTLQAKNNPGYSLNYQNPVRTGYVIRRLTPVECERLMAFPDSYTEIGHDGKIMSDSTRYQMLGNSIVVHVLAYIMQNIAELLGGTAR